MGNHEVYEEFSILLIIGINNHSTSAAHFYCAHNVCCILYLFIYPYANLPDLWSPGFLNYVSRQFIGGKRNGCGSVKSEYKTWEWHSTQQAHMYITVLSECYYLRISLIFQFTWIFLNGY